MRPRSSEVVFIVDEDAGTNVRDGIVLANGKAVMLYDHVPKGTADVDWLPQAHLWGNAIITRDLNMRKIPFERDALRRCGCHVFIIRCRGATFETLKNLATKHYEKMGLIRFSGGPRVPVDRGLGHHSETARQCGSSRSSDTRRRAS